MGYYSAGGDYSAAQLSSHRSFSAARDAAAANDTPPEDSLTPSGRRHPRMNPLNPRAARRAMRRLTSFEHIARRIVRFTSARPVHKGRFIQHRRKRR